MTNSTVLLLLGVSVPETIKGAKMAPRKKTVHISGQSLRYLKECVRLFAILYREDVTMQYLTDYAIRIYFRNRVHVIENSDLAHLLNDQLVRDAGI